VDVDRPAIGWLRARYADRFAIAPPVPPLGLPTGGFSVVLAISVFSHLDEPAQQAWLAELSRVLRPGGLLVASTHGRDLLVTRGDLGRERARELLARGFLFAPGDGPFNDDSAFHERPYLENVWGRWFTLELFAARGLMGYQDLSVWRTTRSETSPAP
jgi:SAM-dependent methyltransferase